MVVRWPWRRVTLIAMRLEDMTVRHPEMVVLRCGRCGHDVGVWPSGQRVLRRRRVDLVCHVCRPPGLDARAAPGVMEELLARPAADARAPATPVDATPEQDESPQS